MSIATLLVVCLANDPQPDATTAILGASALGHAVVRDFDASLPANVDPRLDPAALPLEREGSGESTFSYTYGEAGYERTHIDDIDRYSDAFYLRGSFGFLKYFNVIAGIEREETNFDDIRVDTFELGGGAHYAILPKLDLVGEMLFLYDQIESDSISGTDDNTGFSLYGGARYMALPWDRGGLEVNGGFRYTDLDRLASDTKTAEFDVGARAHFLEHLSAGLTLAFIEDDRRVTVNFRYSF